MEENCYIHGKGCEEDSYSISKWRNQFGNDYPKYHYFYDGFEFERDQSKLFDLKTVLKKYLEPYFEGTLSDLTDGLPTIETDMSDFYLQEKCDGCPSAKRPRPLSQMPPKYCKDSFALIFQIQLAMDDRKICRICNSTDASAECKVCRMSPLRATKIAKEHKKDEDNEKTLLISDLRLGGHAVKLKIDFTYYRCSRRIDFTKALPFLYGDSTSMTRVSKRLGDLISRNLIDGRGPKYISEACAIPHGTIKKWRERDKELCRKQIGYAQIKQLSDAPTCKVAVHRAEKIVSFIGESQYLNYSAPALLRAYPKREYQSISNFVQKPFRYDYPPDLLRRIPLFDFSHLVLLAYDYFIGMAYDHPLVRALMVCLQYCESVTFYNRPSFFLVSPHQQFFDWCREIDADNIRSCLANMEACFAEKSQFLSLCADSTKEFYKELAMFRPENSSQTSSDVKAWWDYYRHNFDSNIHENFEPLELDLRSQKALRHIDQMCLQSWFYPKEMTVFLTYYNPFFLAGNSTYPSYPLEETRFEDRNDSSDFLNAIPYGAPIDVLEEMLLAGMPLDDDSQTLSERIRELRSRPNRQEWDG